ncbi:dihydrodipicolinate synthase family protein [Dongia deserti]|uniref:dihydrodipicolinate synthase family protein n=1 Tax=Dongia deserti TaxID=2268030 RepID=UPI000E64B942|nr:dihydrodipicolinate synthase family protein [Dongia deserti]
MPSQSSRFGLSAALTTPFDPRAAIDLGRLTRHARWCLDNGCGSVTVFGTTGEGASIGLADRQAALRAMMDAGFTMRRAVVAGVSAPSLAEAVSQAQVALNAGCRALLVAPPFYFKNVDDEGVYTWFAQLIWALGDSARDFILYNIPSVTHVTLTLDLIGRLRAAFPNVIIGVKDSSGDWDYAQRLLAAHKDLAILIGDERLLAKSVRLGAQGAISGLANLCPQVLAQIIETGSEDARIAPLVEEVLKYPVTAAIKAVLAHRTRDDAWLATRAPLVGLGTADAKRLSQTYDMLFAAAAA